jgi:hypothetical protein
MSRNGATLVNLSRLPLSIPGTGESTVFAQYRSPPTSYMFSTSYIFSRILCQISLFPFLLSLRTHLRKHTTGRAYQTIRTMVGLLKIAAACLAMIPSHLRKTQMKTVILSLAGRGQTSINSGSNATSHNSAGRPKQVEAQKIDDRTEVTADTFSKSHSSMSFHCARLQPASCKRA